MSRALRRLANALAAVGLGATGLSCAPWCGRWAVWLGVWSAALLGAGLWRLADLTGSAGEE